MKDAFADRRNFNERGFRGEKILQYTLNGREIDYRGYNKTGSYFQSHGRSQNYHNSGYHVNDRGQSRGNYTGKTMHLPIVDSTMSVTDDIKIKVTTNIEIPKYHTLCMSHLGYNHWY